MFLIDDDSFDDDDKKIEDINNESDDDFYVEDEKMETVFGRQTKKVETRSEELLEKKPQDNEEYVIESQLIVEETDNLSPISVSKEMRKSFLEYAMSVIVSRALPDARDGLKPVHRRILYGMQELGITSSTAHKKSARIVGDVLGKYHPHGDTAVYESMVRMAQPFSMRYPLVDGHGNFGSIDGDSAAAMRYTEARMSKIAMAMVEGIRKNTVNFIPNYDGSDSEPEVLPSKFPNLLVSGATGIAVGMATNIPPHNLTEVINGVIGLARNPEITIEELMQIITGPDFPTGGIILGRAGIKKAYLTGRGSVPVRSKTDIEQLKNGKYRIIVTEIPFMVNKAKLVEKIAILVRDKVISGITDIRDESSRKGMRVVVELRKDVVPEVIQNKLFKLTQLQSNFSVNMLALVNGQPETLDLKRALSVYLDHQIDVVVRRTQFDLDKSEARQHILLGLKKAIENIDEIIKIVRSAKDDKLAIEQLIQTFDLSPTQAKAIIEMRLSRLTGLAIEKMENEIRVLDDEITELKSILQDRQKLLDLIVSELEAVRDKFGDSRNTSISDSAGEIDDEDLIPVKDIAITMTSRGYVKRIPLNEYSVQNRGGVGSKSISTYEDDNTEKILTTTTHTDLLILSTFGKIYRIRAHQIPELSKQSKGVPFINLVSIDKTEKVASLLTTDSYEKGLYIVIVTAKGIIKKTSLEEFSRINRNGKRAITLKEEDSLFKAMIVKDDGEILIGSSLGKVVRFDASQIRAMGRTAAGVKGINLSDHKNNLVVGASSARFGGLVFSLGKDGFGKLTPIDEYRKTNRGGKGVTSIDTKKAGKLRFMKVVNGDEDILVITKDGITIRTSLEQINTTSRATKGVKVIKLKDKNTIKSVAVINTKKIQEQVDEAIRKTQEVDLKKINEIAGKEIKNNNVFEDETITNKE